MQYYLRLPNVSSAGLFANPELTTNTKLLYVHGGADDYTLAEPCVEHIKRIKAKPNQIEIDIKEGWYHEFHMGKKPFKVRGAMTHWKVSGSFH